MNIAIIDASNSNYIKSPLQIDEGEWHSLYLKVWNKGIIVDGREIETDEDLKWLIEEALCIGHVQRIDVNTRKTRGGVEQKFAFIHFHMWDRYYGDEVRRSIEKIGCFTADESVKTREIFRNSHGARSYFRFYKNLNPAANVDYQEMNKEQAIMRCQKLDEAFKRKNEEVQRFIDTEYIKMMGVIDGLRAQIASQYVTQ